MNSDRPELQEVFCLTYCRTEPAPPVVPCRLLSHLALAKEADGSLPEGLGGRRRSSLAIASPLLSHLRLHFVQLEWSTELSARAAAAAAITLHWSSGAAL